MRKPQPPSFPSAPAPPSSPFTSPDDADLKRKHPPIPSPLSGFDESPFVNTLESPIISRGKDTDKSVCESCENLWAMQLGGQVKNRKPDGSEFILHERYCIFKTSLVALAERQVLSCTRYTPKVENPNG